MEQPCRETTVKTKDDVTMVFKDGTEIKAE